MPSELTSDRTFWVFVSDSDEPRHLHDIVFAIDVLRRRSIPDSQILVFTDHPLPGPHFDPHGIRHQQLKIMASTLCALKDCDAAVLVATGHGDFEGIGAGRTVLTPHALLEDLRSIPNLGVGVAILCQCFAGIFDLVDARSAPPVVLIGATRLNNSLSALHELDTPLKQQDGSDGLKVWLANIFLVHFFDWIANPKDIDGDGLLTLADAFKYAGVFSNKKLIEIKSRLYLEIRQMVPVVEQLLAKVREPTATAFDEMSFIAADRQLQARLETLHLHQEPWILHANLAREVKLRF